MKLRAEDKVISFKQFKPALLAVLILFLLASVFWNTSLNSQLPQRLYGQPVASTEFADAKFSWVEQIVDDGQRIYVLPTAPEGIIQVYDLQGQYLNTLVFYNHTNGAFTMAVEDGTLYVRDKRQNVYVFEDGQFQRFLIKEDAKVQLAYVDFGKGESSPDYTLRSGSIRRISQGEDTCVIENIVSIEAWISNKWLAVLAVVLVMWTAANFLRNKVDQRR